MRGLAGEEAGPTSTRARQVLLMEEGEAGLGDGGGQGRVPAPSESTRASQRVSKILDGRGSSLKKTNRTQHKAINDFGYHSIEFDKVLWREQEVFSDVFEHGRAAGSIRRADGQQTGGSDDDPEIAEGTRDGVGSMDHERQKELL